MQSERESCCIIPSYSQVLILIYLCLHYSIQLLEGIFASLQNHKKLCFYGAVYIYSFSWNNLKKNKQADTKEDALNTSAGEARPLVYGKHLFLSLQCSFLPKFSIHIETKYEDNKGSNDSVSTMAFADFHLILVVNFGRCSLMKGAQELPGTANRQLNNAQRWEIWWSP